MAVSLVPVIEALYSYLTGDSTFNTSIGGSSSAAGKLYYGMAPKDTEFPLVDANHVASLILNECRVSYL